MSSRSGKGRHTTRHVSLLRLPGDGGLLADTPGFSQPSLNLVTSGELGDLFPEVRSRILPIRETYAISSFNIKHILTKKDWHKFNDDLGSDISIVRLGHA